jgi:SAM-dependent methyltransferase
MNVLEYNSQSWDKAVESGNPWSVPVGADVIEKARNGEWEIILTPIKATPREWFGEVQGKDILCLASGGGQQAPILAAAGARVTSFDNSARQLEQDAFVAQRENLEIRLEKGDAADLSRFADGSFDLIFHPCSNCFMEKLEPIWREAYRVLRPGGALLSGFNQPFIYIFDRAAEENDGVLQVRHRLPYADLESLNEAELNEMIAKNEAVEWSHTLDEQIGGQIAAGFVIAGFFEDWWTDEARLLNKFAPTFIATKAVKLFS